MNMLRAIAVAFGISVMLLPAIVKNSGAMTPDEFLDRVSQKARASAKAMLANKSWNGDQDNWISKTEFFLYLRDQMFQLADRDRNGWLSLSEYRQANLFCRPTDQPERCDLSKNGNDTVVRDRYHRDRPKAPDGTSLPLTAGSLAGEPGPTGTGHEGWRKAIADRRQAHWQIICRLSGGSCQADSEVLYKYFLELERRKDDVNRAQKRLASGSGYVGNDRISRGNYWRFWVSHWFDLIDTDFSGNLSLLEVTQFEQSDTTAADFLSIAGPGFVISKNDLINGPDGVFRNPNTNTRLAQRLQKDADDNFFLIAKPERGKRPYVVRDRLSRELEVEQTAYERELAKAYKDCEKQSGYVKDEGYVFGTIVCTKEKDGFAVKKSEFATIVRLIKDYDKIGKFAEPAAINWTKQASEDATIDWDAVLRVDLNIPNPEFGLVKNLRPGIAVDWERSGEGSSRNNRRKFLLTAHFDLIHNEWGWWKTDEFQIGPVFDQDLQGDVERLGGVITWDPQIFPGRFSSGFRHKLTDGGSIKAFWRPRFGINLAEVISEPEGQNSEDDTFLRYGLELGFSFFDSFEARYEVKQIHSLDDLGVDNTFHDSTIRYYFDPDQRFSASFNFQKGKETSLRNDFEQYRLGLGVKF